MNWSNSGVVLVILLLIVGALVVRHVNLPAYSQEEVFQELSALCGQYTELSERGAEEVEWQSFEQQAREITEPIVADLKNRRDPSPLYQLAMYDLPEAIASRGRTPASDLELSLARQEAVQRRAAERQAARYGDAQEADVGVDLLSVGIGLLDVGLLIAIGYMLFWPVRKRFFVPKDMESMLRQLDKRIARNPESVRYLGTRARLLTEAGRHEDAIADIDWILERKPHGVNLDEWRQLREVVAQKATATD